MAEAAKALQSNLKALGDVGYLTMKNNSKALDLLREANQKCKFLNHAGIGFLM